MKPLIQLITEWDQYTETTPTPTVEGFCSHYRSTNSGSSTHQPSAIPTSQPPVPISQPPVANPTTTTPPAPAYPQALSALSRLIGRTASIQRTCLKLALRQLPEIDVEWYFFLHIIARQTTIRKTDAISINLLLEPTTGIDILNRMIRAGLLDEKTDPADKRARLLSLTEKGYNTLVQSEVLAQEVAHFLFSHLSEQQCQTIDTLLTTIDQKVGTLLTDKKPKSWDEISPTTS